MTVYSMTGYASVEGSIEEKQTFTIELRSVNNRFLDVQFRLAEPFRNLEPRLRGRIGKYIKRGKLEIRIQRNHTQSSSTHYPSEHLLKRLYQLQIEVQKTLPQALPLSVMDVWNIMQVEGAVVATSTQKGWQDHVIQTFEKGLVSLCEARAREGERLVRLLQTNIKDLYQWGREIKALVSVVRQEQQSRFLQRWQEAIESLTTQAIDSHTLEERVLAEVTSLALRSDIAEEIGRLESHVHEIEDLLDQGGLVGKRLDFLIQELHREANTLGAKSSHLKLSQLSVEMKVAIEQMREQVQNLE